MKRLWISSESVRLAGIATINQLVADDRTGLRGDSVPDG